MSRWWAITLSFHSKTFWGSSDPLSQPWSRKTFLPISNAVLWWSWRKDLSVKRMWFCSFHMAACALRLSGVGTALRLQTSPGGLRYPTSIKWYWKPTDLIPFWFRSETKLIGSSKNDSHAQIQPVTPHRKRNKSVCKITTVVLTLSAGHIFLRPPHKDKTGVILKFAHEGSLLTPEGNRILTQWLKSAYNH